ncbi:FAD/NAD(P)-binding domain-containing protein [Amniculicola lignicola CBS 123094]|uniref:FAD/NAD(P)-binding domain-containing protein n=1 Tax=Amniculicola lignicola CBS 123094 TaxID=1392246 RepID=A0A6A5WBC0_9PLEO|nr:FAD/NAD(P)-binding domain-containing protein [Amniculicola lignicola CBS 123094]
MAQTSDIPSQIDLLIIGAGIYGIQAARTYLELHPNHHVVVLESDSAPGGVWGKNRMYDAFWTQSPLDIWEFSDQPMEGVELKDTYHRYFEAKNFTKYLDKYLDSHVYDGMSLTDRIVLNARVEKLWKEGEKWHAKTVSGETYTSPRVIDASGLTSLPNIPDIRDADRFLGTIVHHKDFGKSDIIKTCKSVVVVGGAKSAADLAYSCAKAGLEVSWVIRKNGNGPAAFLPAEAPIRFYKDSNVAFHHRAMATLLASIYAPESWWTAFIHRTRLGRALLQTIWRTVYNDILAQADYDRADGKANGYANLRPDTSIFWQNDSSGVNQRADFYDTIATKVKVHRQNIDHIDLYSVELTDGTSLEADAIIYATGWRDATPYLSPSAAYALGVAADPAGIDPAREQVWITFEKAAESQVVKRFPILAHPPPCYKPERKESPFRLYKGILPIRDRSIAFLGKTELANHTYNAEIQSLFAVAALDGTLKLPEEDDMESDIALVRAWQTKRYPAKGGSGKWFWFDIVPYSDALLEELGLKSHRTRGLGGMFKPTLAQDLKGLIGEYKGKVGGGETAKGK